MRDELRRLPGKHKIRRRLRAPAFDSFRRRRAIEHTVELGRAELRRVVRELILQLQILWEKRTFPRGVMPSGGADEDLGHYAAVRRGIAVFVARKPRHNSSRYGSSSSNSAAPRTAKM